MSQSLSVDVRDGVAVVTLDMPNAAVNTFARPVRDEFARVLDRLERDPAIQAAVIRSGKPDVWVAGADIEEFLQIETSSQAEAMSRDGHALLDRLENLRTPVVAAISGACLGGGLEAALACGLSLAGSRSPLPSADRPPPRRSRLRMRACSRRSSAISST